MVRIACFEDQKARDCIKTMRQGRRTVMEYTEEFCDLACRLDWPEDILIMVDLATFFLLKLKFF